MADTDETKLNCQDFQRLQTQVLNLTERNYQLEDDLKKLKRDLNSAKYDLNLLQKENEHQSQVIKKSKKAFDIDCVLKDNTYLKSKLKDQEEDFKLQNSTLMQELQALTQEKALLENKIDEIYSQENVDHPLESKEASSLKGEIKYLKTRYDNLESNSDKTIFKLQQRIQTLVNQNAKLEHIMQTSGVMPYETDIQLQDAAASYTKLDFMPRNLIERDQRDAKGNSDLNKKISLLEDKLSDMDDELKLTDQQLAMVTKEKYDLKCEVKGLKEIQEKNYISREMHDSLVSEMQEKYDLMADNYTDVAATRDRLQSQLNLKNEELESQRQAAEDAQLEARNMGNIIADLKSCHEHDLTCIAAVTAERDELKRNLTEVQKVADDNRTELDDVKKSFEALKEKNDKDSETVLQSSKELYALQMRLRDHEKKMACEARQLNKARCENENLKKMNYDAEFELRELGFEYDALKKTSEKLEKEVADAEEKLKELRLAWETEKKEMTVEMDSRTAQKQELEEQIETLKRQVNDGEEEKRIHERKGISLMKDLKRQLVQEKKRADRLQEKLAQLLADPSQLSQITSSCQECSDDTSSVSSWSIVSGDQRDGSTRDNSMLPSPEASPTPFVACDDVSKLIAHIADLQQEKWQLEEKLSHLESSSSAMANDILNKAAVIQYLCQNDRLKELPVCTSPPAAEKVGLARAVGALKDVVLHPDEVSREINRRTQTILEETIQKNINLQKDVEHLTEQVHQLSQLAAKHAEKTSDVEEEVDITEAFLLHGAPK